MSTYLVKRQSPIALLTGDPQPHFMSGLLFSLVTLLHIYIGLYVLKPEPLILAKPLPLMTVSLVTEPTPVVVAPPVAAPKPPPPVPPKPEVKPKPVVKPKPIVKPKPVKQPPKEKPVVHKPEPLPVVEPTPVAPPKVVSHAAPVMQSKPVIEKPQFTEARVGANYGYNPKPKYPSTAKSRGWTGKVLLRVHVSPDGDSEEVTVLQSSGHDILDEAAVDAVERWRFVPGKRGDIAVASTVNVPINFALE